MVRFNEVLGAEYLKDGEIKRTARIGAILINKALPYFQKKSQSRLKNGQRVLILKRNDFHYVAGFLFHFEREERNCLLSVLEHMGVIINGKRGLIFNYPEESI